MNVNLRYTDVVARYGGEEFVGLFEDIEQAALIKRIEELRQLIEKMEVQLPDCCKKIMVTITVSIGIAMCRSFFVPFRNKGILTGGNKMRKFILHRNNKIITHADTIRNMSDEELAIMLAEKVRQALKIYTNESASKLGFSYAEEVDTQKEWLTAPVIIKR